MISSTSLPSWYADYKNFIESSISEFLYSYFEDRVSEPLKAFQDIILYSTHGGKKLRSILALETYLSLSKKDFSSISKDDDIIKLCIAIELVHAFSLVHDDLPCMDNDTLRRGQKTVWYKYSESDAVLCGDLLQALCFEVISQIGDSKALQKILRILSRSLGLYGMVGGQIEDLYYEKYSDKVTEKILRDLHNKKTGKLIEASILCAKAFVPDSEVEESKLQIFGEHLGLAYQIKDDLLDVLGDAITTGKSVGGEIKGFVHVFGVGKSTEILHEYINTCKTIAKLLDSKKILFLVEYIESRVA